MGFQLFTAAGIFSPSSGGLKAGDIIIVALIGGDSAHGAVGVYW